MEQTPKFVIRHTEQLDDEPRVYVNKPLDEGGIFCQGTQGPAHASPACLTSILNMISGLKEGILKLSPQLASDTPLEGRRYQFRVLSYVLAMYL